METEYIRGKVQERNGALTRRPNAKFDARGNDVWAERSGREFMPQGSGMSGGSYSSPVTGNGMGNISRLVGGKLRRGGSTRKQQVEREKAARAAAMSPEERREVVERQAAQEKAAQADRDEQQSHYYDTHKSLGDMRYEARQANLAEYEKSHPGIGFLNKLGRAVPGVARGVAATASYLVPGARIPAMGLAALANQMDKDSSKARRPGEMSGGAHSRYRIMVGGSELSISPYEAQQILMMDYRGGRHPYLTKTGRERKHVRGSGIFDSIKSVASKAYNELTNPDSKLRKEYIPKAAEGLEKVADFTEKVAPFVPGGYGEAAKKAAAAIKVASKVAKGVNAANKAVTAAQHLVPGTKYSNLSKGIGELGDAFNAVKGSYDDYSAYKKEQGKFPRPNLPSKSQPKPTGVRDSNGSMLAIKDREPSGRDMLRLEDRKAPLLLEDREAPLLLEDRPKTPKFARNYEVEGDLRSKDRRNAELRAATQRRRAKSSNPFIRGLAGSGETYGSRQVPVLRDLDLMTPGAYGSAKPRRTNARAEIVRRVMSEEGLSMIEASKYVKAHNLY